jgi:hypothetical protein
LPDLNLAITNHHKTMQQWWKKPEYIKARKEFCKRNLLCVRCGRPAVTPGHSAEDYHSFETYLAAVISDKCEPLCIGCNFQESKSRKPCPVCVSVKAEKIYYIGQHQEHCYLHRPAEEIRQSEERKEVFKALVKQSQSIRNAKRRKLYQEMKRK